MIDFSQRDPLRQAQELLEQAAHPGLRQVSVDRQGDLLVLRGHVQSFYDKQVAQEAIRPAAEGLQLVNRVTVD